MSAPRLNHRKRHASHSTAGLLEPQTHAELGYASDRNKQARSFISPRRNSAGVSLAGFFSKLRPSNRPERGGTLRSQELGGHQAARTVFRISEPMSGKADEQEPKSDIIAPGFWNAPNQISTDRRPKDDIGVAERLVVTTEKVVRTGPGDRAQTIFQEKREARRLRRSLKDSGDFLGVQGINPRTGELDVMTPSTTSDSTPRANSRLDRLAQNAHEAQKIYQEGARKERLRREREKLKKAERAKESVRAIQRHARWRKEEGQWSSVAEPRLSPIAQSQYSGTPPHASDSTTIHRAPMPGHFLGTGAPLAMKESRPDTVKTGVLDSLTNKTTRHNQKTKGSATAMTAHSIGKPGRFRMTPLIPHRSEPSRQATGRARKDKKEASGREITLIDVETFPPKSRMCTHSAQMTENKAESWADRVLRDIDGLGGDIRWKSHDKYACIPIITTTGSVRSRRVGEETEEEGSITVILHDSDETLDEFNDPASQVMSLEELGSIANSQFIPLSATAPEAAFNLLDFPPRMRQSVWPSITTPHLQSRLDERSLVQASSVRRQLLPVSATTSEPVSSPMRKLDFVDPTRRVSEADAVVLATEKKTMARTMRKGDAAVSRTSTSSCPQTSSRQVTPSPSLDLDLLAMETEAAKQNGVMAQEAARLAFVQHAATAKVVQVPRIGAMSCLGSCSTPPSPGTKQERNLPKMWGAMSGARTQSPASARQLKAPEEVGKMVLTWGRSRRDSNGIDGIGSLFSNNQIAMHRFKASRPVRDALAENVRIAGLVTFKFAERYCRFVSPVLQAQSSVRKRLRRGQSTWGDCAVWALAMLLVFILVLATLWLIKGVCIVSRFVSSVIRGFAFLSGF